MELTSILNPFKPPVFLLKNKDEAHVVIAMPLHIVVLGLK